MELSSKSGAATVTAVVMGGAITAVAAIITVGAEAAVTTMVGGIIAIGGDLIISGHFEEAALSWRPRSFSSSCAGPQGGLAAIFNEKPAGVNRRAWQHKNPQPWIERILWVRMRLLHALRMSQRAGMLRETGRPLLQLAKPR